VTIYNVACFVGTSAVVGWEMRPRWTTGWFVLTGTPLLAMLLLLGWRGGQVSVGPPGPVDLAFIVLFGALWYVLTPRGDRLIARFRASTSPQFQFDRSLHLAIQPLGRLLWSGPPEDGDAEWRRSVSQTGREALSTIAGLAPPSREWAEVRDAYASLLGDELAAAAKGEMPRDSADFEVRTAAISSRVDELRLAYGLKRAQ
jgi:hypothetical protein